MRVLVSGASGYYGQILLRELIAKDIEYIAVDLNFNSNIPLEKQVVCDLCNREMLQEKMKEHDFDVIVHLASQIDFAVPNQLDLYSNNIVSTKNLAELGVQKRIKKFIFTSSNSIFLGYEKTLIAEADEPKPIDMYGRSKFQSEKILKEYQKFFDVNILRCPNIIDAGRVGMMSILFDLLMNNSTLWVLGDGSVRHQCLYAQDLNAAIMKLLKFNNSSTHNIGSDNVPTFLDLYKYLILKTGSKSKIRSIPSASIFFIKLMYKFKISPLGPYQFRMLTKDFIFDTSKIKLDLNWRPTKNNSEIIEKAYSDYRKKIDSGSFSQSANSSPVSMGILGLLKYIKW